MATPADSIKRRALAIPLPAVGADALSARPPARKLRSVVPSSIRAGYSRFIDGQPRAGGLPVMGFPLRLLTCPTQHRDFAFLL